MIKKLIAKIRSYIADPYRDLTEKMFLGFAGITELAAITGFILEIIIGHDFTEIMVIVGILIFLPTVTIICLNFDRLRIAIRILTVILIFIALPGLYFSGGGIKGAGILWAIFACLFVGLVIHGVWRIIDLCAIFAVSSGCLLLEYNFPNLVDPHDDLSFFTDILIAIILIGLISFVMMQFQNKLYKDENNRARKEAERAEDLTRAQNRFFSSMSHEIRTPINSILGLNEVILRDQKASDEIIKEASGIQGAGKMLLALINDILDFSKIEAGSMDIVPVDYRVGDMLSEIVNMIWLRASDKGLKFNVNVDPGVPSVLYGDEVRIKQIMINILNNAVKYTKEGYIDLHIESTLEDEDHVMLSITISDTGMGIKKESLPYLFDAFKRVDEEKNRHIEGTGLGLSIVKQLTELMGGTITVNSVYGEGSSFTVLLKQGISDKTAIGELNIHNQQNVKRSIYESSFKAPDARILIVDDNEMNLEVEAKLLEDTEVVIDKALSGKEALELTLDKKFDVILMDHLMPWMDGVECLERIRNQAGGLNRTTPVVVLTANAGSANRDLYNRAGFDGYLVKPVSGDALEKMLMKHISQDKLTGNKQVMSMSEDINTSSGYSGKASVVITSTGMCDLPDSVIRRLNLKLISFLIHTDDGVFKDGTQMDANELIRYIRSGKNAVSAPPDESAYTEFFSSALKKAHHLIHISLASTMSQDYKLASEAAKSFDNVTVINSGCLSSATGLLVLIAYKLVQQNIPVQDIISELKEVRSHLRCSFVIDKTEYMARKGHVSHTTDYLARALNLHPIITVMNDRSRIGGIWMGKTKSAYKKYIASAFPVDIIPDPEVAFITYMDVPTETLDWIKEEIGKYAYFENIVIQQASAAISSNCGPGTFGILYFVKSNKSYNIASYLEDLNRDNEPDQGTPVIEYSPGSVKGASAAEEETPEEEDGKTPYDDIEGIDSERALKNSGSEEAFRMVLRIFYDSIDAKSSEIEKYYSAGDWKNYTIKVHALKSSAKLIGAMDLAQKAQKLEDAGKGNDTAYINENHDSMIADYRSFSGRLEGIFEGEEKRNPVSSGTLSGKPVIDEDQMKGYYERLREAADNMDYDSIEEVYHEISDLSLPESELEKLGRIRDLSENFDYDSILEILDQ